MKEELITFETAKSAKEKGFNIRCNLMYDRNEEIQRTPDIKKVMLKGGGIKELKTPPQIFAPTQSLLQKWLREKHKLIITITWHIDGYSPTVYDVSKGLMGCLKYHEQVTTVEKRELNGQRYENIKFEEEWHTSYITYEESLEKGLQEALKLIKV